MNRSRLLVTAYFGDGSTRDVTRQAVYESNMPDLADVDEDGRLATGSQGGLFAIMVRFGEKIATFRGTIPFGESRQASGVVENEPSSSAVDIDQYLAGQWGRLGVVPSEAASDEMFIPSGDDRRVRHIADG